MKYIFFAYNNSAYIFNFEMIVFYLLENNS